MKLLLDGSGEELTLTGAVTGGTPGAVVGQTVEVWMSKKAAVITTAVVDTALVPGGRCGLRTQPKTNVGTNVMKTDGLGAGKTNGTIHRAGKNGIRIGSGMAANGGAKMRGIG